MFNLVLNYITFINIIYSLNPKILDARDILKIERNFSQHQDEHGHLLNMNDQFEDKATFSEGHYFIVFNTFEPKFCKHCTELYDRFQNTIKEVRERYDEDQAMFGVRNESQPENSVEEVWPYFSIHRNNAIVDTYELDPSKIDTYTVEWMKNQIEKDVLFNKQFAIIDNEHKAKKFDFNDGFNQLILHVFEDFVFYKFHSEKELIEQNTLGQVSGEAQGRQVEIDEDYQHENILYMLYALSFNRDLDVFGHLKIVAIKHTKEIIDNINNEKIKQNLINYHRVLHGLLQEEDQGHMNRHQMLMNQKLAELEEMDEHNKTMEQYLDEPKQIQIAASQIKKEPSPTHKKKHNPDPTPLYEYTFNLFLYEPSEEKEEDQIKYMPAIMAASLFRIKVWVLSEIGPHFQEDDVAHNSLYLIQGTIFQKQLVLLQPLNDQGMLVKKRVEEFSKYQDKEQKAKYNHELHSEKYYDFLKAFDNDLVIIAHPMNSHHFTQTMTFMLGYGGDDLKEPQMFIMEHKNFGYNKYIFEFKDLEGLSNEKLMAFINDYKEKKLTRVTRTQDCKAFDNTHYDIFERMCGDNMVSEIKAKNKYALIIVDNVFCEFECMKRMWIVKHFILLNSKRQTNDKQKADEWTQAFVDHQQNDIEGTEFWNSMPHILFQDKEKEKFETIVLGNEMDVICFTMNFYGFKEDFELDIYESDKIFGKKMRKYFDRLRLDNIQYLLGNQEFSKINDELGFEASESARSEQLDEMHDFLTEFDMLINHNQDEKEDLEGQKGRRHKGKHRFTEHDLEQMPIEQILRRQLRGKGELLDEDEEELEEELAEDEEFEYQDEASGKWVRESDMPKMDM